MAPTHYSILIADDEQSSRETLRDIIEPEGFQTVVVDSGEAALDVVQERPIHLLVCDMYMQRLTGLETLQLLRQMNALVPFILVSGRVDEALLRQALLAKAYTVLAKPVSKNVFLYTVARALIKGLEQTA